MLKGTPLKSKTLKVQKNSNLFLRSAWTLKSERYAKDNLEIYSKMN
jgi:hypothetical protein